LLVRKHDNEVADEDIDLEAQTIKARLVIVPFRGRRGKLVDGMILPVILRATVVIKRAVAFIFAGYSF